jgi:hypothetical protein
MTEIGSLNNIRGATYERQILEQERDKYEFCGSSFFSLLKSKNTITIVFFN